MPRGNNSHQRKLHDVIRVRYEMKSEFMNVGDDPMWLHLSPWLCTTLGLLISLNKCSCYLMFIAQCNPTWLFSASGITRWIMMSHHDEPSWFVMMNHHDSCWRIITIRRDESSWFIMMNHHDSSWWIKMIHDDGSWGTIMNVVVTGVVLGTFASRRNMGRYPPPMSSS